MSYWEFNLPAVALMIASLLFVAVAIAPLAGWTPEDDTQKPETADSHMEHETR